MTDRIDELVHEADCIAFKMADEWFDGSDVSAGERFAAKDELMTLVTELATIAREAKAERDALRLRVDELSRMVDAGLQVSAERVLHGE